MAVRLPATASLGRSAAYFDPTDDWTVFLHARQGTTTPGPGFRQYWLFGDPAFVNPYLYIGSPGGTSNTILLEVWDGATTFDSTALTPTPATWTTLAATYDVATTTLTLYADNVAIGTLVFDLSSLTFVETDEDIGGAGGGFGDFAVSYLREWQAVLASAERAAEALTTQAVKTTDLLSDTRLVVPTQLADISGHSRDWTAAGAALTYLTGPTGLRLTPGNLFVLSDLFDSTQGDAVELVRASGLIAQGRTESFFEFGDVLPSGIFGGGRETSVGNVLDGFAIYSQPFALQTLNTTVIADHALHFGSPTYAWGTGTFFFMAIAKAAGRAVLYKITSGGVIQDTWTLPSNGDATVPIAINLAGTVLYYSTRSPGVAIFAYDLVNDVALPNVVAGSGTVRWGMQFYVTADDDILVPTRPSGGAPSVWEMRRYNSAWVLQDTWALDTNPNTNYFPEVSSDPDPSLVWVRTFSAGFASAATSVFTCYRIATGAVVITFPVDNLDGTGFVPTSCPWWVIRAGVVPPPTPPARRGIRRLRSFPLPFDRSFWMYIRRIEFLIQSGVGLTTGQGQFPHLEVRFSGDGGLTWGPIIFVSMGLTGEFDLRPVINNVGKMRNGWCEVTDSDPVRSYLLDCYVDAEENTH